VGLILLQLTEQERVVLYYLLEYGLNSDVKIWREQYIKDPEVQAVIKRLLDILGEQQRGNR
jgi:hypothetical protein